MTISEGLTYLKSLKARHAELVSLRNENSVRERRYYGEKTIVTEPVYRIKDVEKQIGLVAKEIRLLEQSIKTANAVTQISFTENEAVWDNVE